MSFLSKRNEFWQLSISVISSNFGQPDAEVTLLQRHGYKASAHGAHEALDAVFPDLFVINLDLEDGLVLTHRIRQRSHHVGIVLVIGADNDSGKVRAFASGADNCLYKPYATEELLAVVGSLSRRLVGFTSRRHSEQP